MQPTAKHIILYADDDSDDHIFIKQAFKKYDQHIKVEAAFNGEEALNYLNDLNSADLHPCLVILDINMPKLNGKETLRSIRQSEKLKELPVVLFSTSSSVNDKEFAKRWNATFVSKPLTYTDLVGITEQFVKHCNTNVNLESGF